MNEIIRTEKIKEIETIGAAKAGEDIIKDTFDYEPLQKEIINNIFISYAADLRVITFQDYIQIFVNKDLNVIYSYIKHGGKWQELDKEQAKEELKKLYIKLGTNKLKQLKKQNIKHKYNLIGYLLKYKFNYKKFTSWEVTTNNFICFNFISKEGYTRSWLTKKSNIIEYLNYNNTDIKKVLFDF